MKSLTVACPGDEKSHVAHVYHVHRKDMKSRPKSAWCLVDNAWCTNGRQMFARKPYEWFAGGNAN